MATTTTRCHTARGRAQDSAPQWEGADIVRLYGQTYGATHPVPSPHHKGMHDLMACRTAELGGHAEQGEQGGCERYADNSCHTRHCPTCQRLAKEKWREERNTDLLPVPYFPCVCTLPHALNPLVLSNQRALLSLLLRATSPPRVQVGHHNLGGQLGGLLLLPTWEQPLKAHFHVHALVPGGALADQGTRGVATHPHFFLPVHARGRVFRGKLLAGLRQSRETWKCTEQTAPRASAPGWQRLLASF
jgi:hypothetical protein